ncbi:MAG: hypothetical protein HQL71_10525 [Magnetococcales bacterium]|nr:hypothetical protein [Magnetococcales bacterium]
MKNCFMAQNPSHPKIGQFSGRIGWTGAMPLSIMSTIAPLKSIKCGVGKMAT